MTITTNKPNYDDMAAADQKAKLQHYVVQVCASIIEAIREVGEIPSGHLYAQLMDKLSLENYELLITKCLATGLIIRRKDHMLVWVGDKQ